jgi:hypothetical protein
MEYLLYKFKISVDVDNFEDGIYNLEILVENNPLIILNEIDYLDKFTKNIKKYGESLLQILNSQLINYKTEENENIIFPSSSNHQSSAGSMKRKKTNIMTSYHKVNDYDNLERKVNQIVTIKENELSNIDFKAGLFKSFSLIKIRKVVDMVDKIVMLINSLILETRMKIKKKKDNESMKEEDDLEVTYEKHVYLLYIKASILNFISKYIESSTGYIQSAYFTYLEGIETSLLYLTSDNYISMKIRYSYIKFLFTTMKDAYRAYLFYYEFKSKLDKAKESIIFMIENKIQVGDENEEFEERVYKKKIKNIEMILSKAKKFHDSHCEEFKSKYRVYFPHHTKYI